MINRRGIPTCYEMQAGRPFAMDMIQGAIRVPPDYGRVADIAFGNNLLTFIAENGQQVTARVRYDFLYDGQLSF